mmetsp:Transcript_47698/g.137332  ORF Transcript_47698/g.137332 Transcript_47698/m.137332 type:complete len:246 (+) Transcript_47698:290-1027(+)
MILTGRGLPIDHALAVVVLPQQHDVCLVMLRGALVAQLEGLEAASLLVRARLATDEARLGQHLAALSAADILMGVLLVAGLEVRHGDIVRGRGLHRSRDHKVAVVQRHQQADELVPADDFPGDEIVVVQRARHPEDVRDGDRQHQVRQRDNQRCLRRRGVAICGAQGQDHKTEDNEDHDANPIAGELVSGESGVGEEARVRQVQQVPIDGQRGIQKHIGNLGLFCCGHRRRLTQRPVGKGAGKLS